MIGRRDGLPPAVLDEFERTAELTASNDGMILCLAVNYGGRSEIADAARRLAEDVRAGRLDPDQVGEETVASYLYTSGMSDPGPFDPHRRRNADQQLPALADFVFRNLGYSDALARFPRRRPDEGLPGVRGPRAEVWRAGVTGRCVRSAGSCPGLIRFGPFGPGDGAGRSRGDGDRWSMKERTWGDRPLARAPQPRPTAAPQPRGWRRFSGVAHV